ncbi:hypothetical protein NLI96_g10772 [Meripilus lineatus]|uniref:Uncharacterized protein n=1 Tax=Meripilus lineatus TaxID=2056292 RepID=A0AAD5UT00_9APHY|nr:hypothetical protein NLI96_g10772 [Physisporinus lineatus]
MPRSQDLATWLPILNLKHPLTKIMDPSRRNSLPRQHCATPYNIVSTAKVKNMVFETSPKLLCAVIKPRPWQSSLQTSTSEPSSPPASAGASPPTEMGNAMLLELPSRGHASSTPFLIPTSSRIVPSASYA